jgi:hypothetical protein
LKLLGIIGGTTALYPWTKRQVQALGKDILDRIIKWRMFSAKWELKIKDYYGKEISYSGVRFEGSPQRVYWSYFGPFFTNGSAKVLEAVTQECIKRGLEPKEYVIEAAELLKVMVSRLYEQISLTDQILRGNGIPKSVERRDVSKNIESMHSYITKEIGVVLLRKTISSVGENVQEDVLELKPNIWGIGLNLNAFYRWIRQKFPKRM